MMYDLSLWPYKSDALACFSEAWRFIEKKDTLCEIFKDTREKYKAEENIEWQACLDELTVRSRALGIDEYTVHHLYFSQLLDLSEKFYRREKLSQELFYDTFDDLRVKCEECETVYGIHGSFVAYWFPRFFLLTRFAFGRLEAELKSFPYTSPFNKGEEVINIHIPSKGKLDEKACEESYERAAAFFSKRHFVCDSWLLNPINSALGVDSGIVRFASRYKVIDIIKDPENRDGWRTFSTMDLSDPTSLPEDSRLQRIYKAHLLGGGTIDRGYGVFQLS